MSRSKGVLLAVSREGRGLSLTKASELTGIPRGTLWNWERGKGHPDPEALVKLTAVYEVALDEATGVFTDEIAKQIDRVAWPGGLREFIASPVSEAMRLRPGEINRLAAAQWRSGESTGIPGWVEVLWKMREGRGEDGNTGDRKVDAG